MSEHVEYEMVCGSIALIDGDDLHLLAGSSWRRVRHGNKFYARAKGRVGDPVIYIYVHRVILDVLGEQTDVDHVNGNGLDNRRVNLRPCTKQQNQWNQGLRKSNVSGFKGVSFHQRDKKWVASIRTSEGRKALGRFDSAVKAAEAYDIAALHYHGPFAWLNFADRSQLIA